MPLILKEEGNYKIQSKMVNEVASTAAWGYVIGDIENQKDLIEKLDEKQNNLVAGEGIKIEGDVISSTRSKAEWGNISGSLEDQIDLKEALDSKIDSSALDEKQDVIEDLDNIREGASLGMTSIQVEEDPTVPTHVKNITEESISTWTNKQDTIDDLDDIREGAELGKTALQSFTESDPVYSADKPNIALKEEIPTKVSELENDSGYLTEHQSLDGYDKVFIAVWNKTPVADITQAIADHKDIRIEYQNRMYHYTYTSNDKYYFASYSGTTNAYYITVGISSGAWTNNSTSLQNSILDLATIRSGAALGSTALQEVPDTYATKDYVDNAVEGLELVEIVTSLPETGEKNKTYLLAKSTSGDNDLYDEYMYVNGKWELLGTKQIEVDLTGYLKSNGHVNVVETNNVDGTAGKYETIQVYTPNNKKMVYGICTEQTDGTGFIGGLFSRDATSFAYDKGLAIGGSSNNLLYLGKPVLASNTVNKEKNKALAGFSTSRGITTFSKIDIPTNTSDLTNDSGFLTEETDPTVPAWAKEETKPTYTADEVGALPDTTKIPKQYSFAITEDMVTVTTDATKGVSPYSTSYGYTNIEIDKDAGIEWVEGAVYTFVVDTKMVVSGTYRNVRVRIGDENDGDVWHPLMAYSTSILGGSTYLVKAMTCTFTYKSTMRPEGGLHILYDANTTYAYLVNTLATGYVTIDANGYGARYSLLFPTTKPDVTPEKWSSPMMSSSSGTTKKAVSCKMYADRHHLYNYSANIAAGAVSANTVYQNYYGQDLRYLANTSSAWLTTLSRVFMYLKDFDPSDYSFYGDATIGNVLTLDKLSTRFPSTTDGDIYLMHIGYTTATWYSLSPDFERIYPIWKYTPSTGELVPFGGGSGGIGEETDPIYTAEKSTLALKSELNDKQDVISDLATIRSGASKGATALQSFTETDPVFSASAAAGIKSSDITNWNGKTSVNESTVSGWGFTKNTGTYSKPSGGIPKTDLASAVQTSLGKADTALQSFTESDPVFSASAASGITSTDISNWNGKQAAITSSNKLAYSLISGTPTIPTVNNATLTIQKNGTNVATFTANASSNATANITVPTSTSQLTNNSNFVASSEASIVKILTQSEYDAISSKVSTTLYLIKG